MHFASRFTRIVPALMLPLALALTTYGTPAHAAAKEGKIGFAFSMTGAAAAYGATQKNGAQMAVDEINAAAGPDGIKLVPLFEDDASTPQQGINVYNKFINADKVAVIVGPTLTNTAQVANRIAQQAGVPALGISNTMKGFTDMGDYIFRDSLTEWLVIPNTIKIARDKLGVKKVAVIYGNDDAFTKGSYDAFKATLTDAGIQILCELTFAKGDRDFSPQLTQIKALNPDAIIASALVEEASGIISQARQLGIPKSVPIIGGNGFNSPSLVKNAGEAAEGAMMGTAWHSTSPNPLNKRFVEAYTAKHGIAPDQFAAQAYTAVYLIHEAMQKAGTTENRKAIRDAMAQIRDFDTVLGKFSFTSVRDAEHQPVVQVVKDGKFTVYGE
ncbi:MAG: ABC transporter substrate-binding protein [Syntrophobacteraceae bacterium]|nr:ABC transporter substrate-binding protein [Desulfobacteraceae bacterium]